MRALAFFIQLLFWLMVIRLVLRGLSRMLAGTSSRRPAPPKIEDLVQDSVCRTYVPRSRAVSARIGGREVYFCSTACRDQAQAAVARAS